MIRKLGGLTQLSLRCVRMDPGCRYRYRLSRLHAPLGAGPGPTHQGMRRDTAGREQEAKTGTTRKDMLSLPRASLSLSLELTRQS